jgi:hypothetical protein
MVRITAPLDPTIRRTIAHELRRIREARHRSHARIRIATGSDTVLLQEWARQAGLDEAEASLRAIAFAAWQSERDRFVAAFDAEYPGLVMV